MDGFGILQILYLQDKTELERLGLEWVPKRCIQSRMRPKIRPEAMCIIRYGRNIVRWSKCEQTNEQGFISMEQWITPHSVKATGYIVDAGSSLSGT